MDEESSSIKTYTLIAPFIQAFTELHKEYLIDYAADFEFFRNKWKLKSMDKFTYPLTLPENSIHFLDEAFDFLVDRLSSRYHLPTRILSIYTMYALFINQSVSSNGEKAVRISIALDDCKNIELLKKILIEGKHIDCFIVILKLKAFNAFAAVVARGRFYRGFDKDTAGDTLATITETFANKFRNRTIPNLINLHDHLRQQHIDGQGVGSLDHLPYPNLPQDLTVETDILANISNFRPTAKGIAKEEETEPTMEEQLGPKSVPGQERKKKSKIQTKK
ncbi:uncharacterized protein LOC136037736 [Artemia franciscana]|uniref:Uncharacterized protein n=1 Tax=Artemia franciscana TaxID=6661 RepID=A0AA88I629_ARTSF|nr:hypothetical protein QYM36_010531 [Artemia franciscana]